MAMLNVGQFEHALNELLAWLDKTDQSLDDATSSHGDHKHLEIELAKLKVNLLYQLNWSLENTSWLKLKKIFIWELILKTKCKCIYFSIFPLCIYSY